MSQHRVEIAMEEKGATPETEAPPTLVEGTTSLRARCLRAGGVEPRAELCLANGDLLDVDVSEETAKLLAKRLYDEVVLEGVATWDARTWKLSDFRVTRVTPYRPTDPVLAFEELAEAAGESWKDVDAAAYVRDLRAEGG